MNNKNQIQKQNTLNDDGYDEDFDDFDDDTIKIP